MSSPVWRLSRSQLDLSLECARCFWRLRRGCPRPPGLPFTLNSAIDRRLKTEFDDFRQRRAAHPGMPSHLTPFQDWRLDRWRNTFQGVEHLFEPGIVVCGAVDDLWTDGSQVYVADYKATGSKNVRCWPRDKRQLEIYSWLLKKNGLAVAPVGYRLVAHADPNVLKFTLFELAERPQPARLIFRLRCEEVRLDDRWVESAVHGAIEISKLREAPVAGGVDGPCNYCDFLSRAVKLERRGDGEKGQGQEERQAGSGEAPGAPAETGRCANPDGGAADTGGGSGAGPVGQR